MARNKLTAFPLAMAAAVIWIVAALWSGCRRVENVVWSGFETVGVNGWDPVRVFGFAPWPMDSVTAPSDRYTLTLCVRHSARKALPPLHLIVRQSDEEGHEVSDTLRIPLDPPETGPGGRGAYAVYETVDTLARHISLRPGYLVELQSLSPLEQTAGILDVGLFLSAE